jgi:hypothetical protein
MAVVAAPQTRAPAPAPDSAARCCPLGDPTAQWATRSRAAPASTPLDRDNGAPGRGRLCLPSIDIDHQPCSRPPWLSMTGIVQGGGGGGAMPGGGGGGRGGVHVGVGRHCNAATPPVLVAVRQFLRRVHGSYIKNDGQQTNNNQKLTKGGFDKGVSMSCPYHPPPKKTQSAIEIGGRGWQDSIWHRKEGPGTRLS